MNKQDRQDKSTNKHITQLLKSFSPSGRNDSKYKLGQSKQSKNRRKSQFINSESQISKRNKDSSSQHNLITRYYKTVEGSHHSEVEKSNGGIQSINVIQNLENDLVEREAEKQALLIRQNEIAEEINRVEFENESYKKRYYEIAIESLRKLYQNKRQNRLKERSNIGFMIENKYKNEFVEGADFVRARDRKERNKKALASVLSQLQNCQPCYRSVFQSKFEFLTRQSDQISDQLAQLQQSKQELIKLSSLTKQQEQCRLSKGKWPVFSNRYVSLQLLGKGGFSEVYKCFDLQLTEYIALKLSFPLESYDHHMKQTYMKHILREYETQSELNHPNIARVYKRVEMGDPYVLATIIELCTGPELSDYMKLKKYIPEGEAKLIIKQILSALQYMDNYNVIHYDLKPRNVMFNDGLIKILDFGLCKVNTTNETKMQLTSPGAGTYYYLPPEAFESDARISGKVDIWSLGVIFYEMLFAKRPFGHGMKQQKIKRDKIILNCDEVQFPNNSKNEVSNQAKWFITRCLTYDQNQRISASEANRCEYMRLD